MGECGCADRGFSWRKGCVCVVSGWQTEGVGRGDVGAWWGGLGSEVGVAGCCGAPGISVYHKSEAIEFLF